MIQECTDQISRVLKSGAMHLLNKPEQGPAVVIEDGLPSSMTKSLCEELLATNQWEEELWILEDSEDVRKVSQTEFASSARPFSNSWAIHESRRSELPELTRFEQILSSKPVVSTVSECFVQPFEFISLDVARYGKDRFLTRHADLFGGRVVGAVFFLSPGWEPGYGGELTIWNSQGEAQVIPPQQGSVGIFPIHPIFSHAVAKVKTEKWERLSAAAHFGVPNGNPTEAWERAQAEALGG